MWRVRTCVKNVVWRNENGQTLALTSPIVGAKIKNGARSLRGIVVDKLSVSGVRRRWSTHVAVADGDDGDDDSAAGGFFRSGRVSCLGLLVVGALCSACLCVMCTVLQ